MIEVSVCVISYNFENYIKQTIDSIISQKTNFEYEVVICDDASSDRTPEILREYQNEYPDIIRLVLLPENTKMTLLKALENAKGKYIALLEGDDFWCNENKLQMQYDYMEAHPEKSAVVTHLNAVDEFGNPLKMPKDWDKNINKEEFTIKDYERKPISPFIQTLLYRNREEYIEFYRTKSRMDNFIQAMLLYYGYIGILPDVTATYRIVHFHGANYSSKPIDEKAKILFRCGLMIEECFGDKINVDYLMNGYLADSILFGFFSLDDKQKAYFKEMSFKRKCSVLARIISDSILKRIINLIR